MSSIVLVRHGQASFSEKDYDKLHANGEAQARLLGEFWSRRGVGFDRVYSGPRARQLDSARIVSAAYREIGADFPEIEVMSEFDEYQAGAVFRECLPQLLPVHAEIRKLCRDYDASREGGDVGEAYKAFGRLFEAVITKWVTRQVTAPGIEPWQEFCARIERGLKRVADDTPSASSAVIFTSAGAIGAAVRRALHLSAEDTLQVTWMSRNASFTSFLASGERFTLSAFNAHPHLDGDGLLTYR